MGSHQVRIKPVAGPWRRIPRPARLFCCRLQHLPSPTHRGPERLPRAPSPRAWIGSRAPSRLPAALSGSRLGISASPPPRICRIPLGSSSAVEGYREKEAATKSAGPSRWRPPPTRAQGRAAAKAQRRLF
ncbi:hypothetical protein NN561_014496 [Cricetulus griseus]